MFKSIVVGTDGSDTATQAVRQAVDLARAVGATLELVSAYEPVPAQRLAGGTPRHPGGSAVGDQSRARTSTPRWVRPPTVAREAGVTVNVYPRQGDPADAILDVAEEREADLIVVGNKGMTGRQALPARLGAEQGIPPRAMLGADHQDGLMMQAGLPPASV